jgi:predicted RNA-binding protein Jag
MKRILIEWFHCERKETVSSGLYKNPELIKSAMEAMQPFMRTMQVQLDFREVTLTGDETQRADTVNINGKKIGEVIGATDPSEMLVDAILKESARFARCGCGCSPEDLCR